MAIVEYNWASRPSYDVLSKPEQNAVDSALDHLDLNDKAQVREIQAGERKGSYVVNAGQGLKLIVMPGNIANKIVVIDIVRDQTLKAYAKKGN